MFYSFEIDVNAIKNMALMKFFILIISHKLSHTFINVATLITGKVTRRKVIILLQATNLE